MERNPGIPTASQCGVGKAAVDYRRYWHRHRVRIGKCNVLRCPLRFLLHSIWLLDLAKNLPSSAQLEGFDTSSASYPPEEWLPENVKLGIWNVFEGPPESLHNRYDVVHIRLFLVVIKDNDPSPILRHCLKILSMFISLSNSYFRISNDE